MTILRLHRYTSIIRKAESGFRFPSQEKNDGDDWSQPSGYYTGRGMGVIVDVVTEWRSHSVDNDVEQRTSKVFLVVFGGGYF